MKQTFVERNLNSVLCAMTDSLGGGKTKVSIVVDKPSESAVPMTCSKVIEGVIEAHANEGLFLRGESRGGSRKPTTLVKPWPQVFPEQFGCSPKGSKRFK